MNFHAKNFDELEARQVYEILKARAHIFLMEQNIHYVDMDDIDYDSIHFFLEEEGEVRAYLRAYFSDNKDAVKIGRVLSLTHGIGLGKEIMLKAITEIRKRFGNVKICLDSQTHAVAFYEKLGFKVMSEEFLEAGIPHFYMELN